MSNKLLIIIPSWVMFISVIVYLITLAQLLKKLKKTQPQYWESLGSPGSWGPNGQAVIFRKIILGAGMPSDIASKYRMGLIVMRTSLILGVCIFLAMIVMTYFGIIH